VLLTGRTTDLAPPAAVALLILVLTTAPVAAPEGTPAVAPLAVHVGLFAALAAALGWSWWRRGWRRPVLGPATVATAYGLAIELVQVLIPYRTGALIDVVADALGAVLGAAAVRWWLRGGLDCTTAATPRSWV
jgi:VanZ family protein